MDTHQRILIVGGGVFGHGAALALARRGYGHVELLERGEHGSGNTSLAAGILSLHTWNDLDAQLIRDNRRLLEEATHWGLQEGVASAGHAWRRRGGLTIAPQAHRSILETMADRLRRYGEPHRLLDADEAAQRFPQLRLRSDEVALHSDGEGTLESMDVIDLARAWARRLGARFRAHVEVTGLKIDQGALHGVITSAGHVRADIVLLSSGAWTPPLLATAGLHAPLLSYRTQLAVLEHPQAQTVPILHDVTQHFYTRPDSATRFYAGDGTDLRSFDPATYDRAADASFLESMAERILRRFTAGEAATMRTGWAGLCVGTPDRHPLVGPMPGVEGLHLLVGDNGFGLMRGLALGEVAADAMGQRATSMTKGLGPGRFGPDPPRQFPLAEGFSLPVG